MTVTTLNPSDKAASATLSNGNLTITTSAGGDNAARSTTSKSTGKVYYEALINATGGGTYAMGIANASQSLTDIPGGAGGVYTGVSYFNVAGSFYFAGNNNSKSLGSLGAGVYVGIALDMTNKNIWMVGPSGVWNGVALDDPSTNTGGLNGPSFYGPSTGFGANLTNMLNAGSIFAMVTVANNSQFTVNFGATAFHYSVPSGFSAWDSAATVTARHQFIFG